jgi:hypothetical protein
MMNTDLTRALQHLLVQGFALYPCAAAVCMRRLEPAILTNPNHAWAVYFDTRSLDYTAKLDPNDPLIAVFADAAVRSASPKTPHVVCHTQGGWLLVPLTVTDVRSARMRIEAAIALGKAPPAERLEAFPDEMIQREAKRRLKRAKRNKTNQPKKEA